MDLLNYRCNVHSQNGEDGVIEKLFEILQINSGYVCEFGAYDGVHLSNTYNIFKHNKNFTPILIEGKKDACENINKNLKDIENKIIINEFVSADSQSPSSLDNLLTNLNIPELQTDFKLLSIDVDGIDYEIWKNFKKFRPDVVIIEINSSYGLHEDVYDPFGRRAGASAVMMNRLAKEKEYELLCHTGNLIFAKKELYSQVLRFIIEDNSLEKLFSHNFFFDRIIKENRKTLSTIDNFLTQKDSLDSVDMYGIPEHVAHLVDRKINGIPTYVDLMLFLQTFFHKPKIKYVEIGASFLKSFYQVSSFLKECDLYAFDLNPINPTIEKKFIPVDLSNPKIKKYRHNSNNITYFQGDVLNGEDLREFQMQTGKVNVIFSDALHTGEGLRSEYNHYIKDSLDDDFLLYYDDMSPHPTSGMREAFADIGTLIKQNSTKDVSYATVNVNGWLGEHEHLHPTALISSLPLTDIWSTRLSQENSHKINVERLRPTQ
jgi:hypothetical protein